MNRVLPSQDCLFFLYRVNRMSSCEILRITSVLWVTYYWFFAAQSPLFSYQRPNSAYFTDTMFPASYLLKSLRLGFFFNWVCIFLKEKLNIHDWHSTPELRTFISTENISAEHLDWKRSYDTYSQLHHLEQTNPGRNASDSKPTLKGCVSTH